VKPDLLKQVKLIHRAYFAENTSSIQAYFRQCGLIGKTSPNKVLRKLFYNGCYPATQFRKKHKEQLVAYLNWKHKGKKSIKDVFGAGFSKLFSQKQ